MCRVLCLISSAQCKKNLLRQKTHSYFCFIKQPNGKTFLSLKKEVIQCKVTYIANVSETMLPGDSISLLWSPTYLDSPSVSVDVCSISSLQFSCQEDKDCPQVQQSHSGIHEKENSLHGRFSVRLSPLPRQSRGALPYSRMEVEQWSGDNRTESY